MLKYNPLIHLQNINNYCEWTNGPPNLYLSRYYAVKKEKKTMTILEQGKVTVLSAEFLGWYSIKSV